ncbi:3-hydroxyacyl-CoA dehydrogenase NAD-binding domain-containing protein [Flavihumibacter sp. UBA7668]|uniref:3-hydroxyacyl-CoA dehydrogenase NAD-binding domain-containing protein n=1 Tax=Flavihumibacter sp. UBA7668 TaxID=1946542 RepID=UPI0025BDAD57|nr:3-hydroxyacyl-CoA dehydrogenase NAD-binding domain-containing protein [Flavihumibacter sp. UBA7668]
MKNRSLVVCGAGTMGAGIAQTAAQHGFPVLLFDLSSEVIEHAREQIYQRLETLEQKQKITAAALLSIKDSLQFTTSVADCKASVIIEAIAEKLEIKTALFSQLAEINGGDSIYASNTSSLSVEDLAARHPFPDRVVGMHFFNPAALMKLVEVVKTSYTSETVVHAVAELATDMGKIPVICKDSPGFIVNRVARPFYIEALRMAEEGVPIELIDQLMEAAGFKMGPFKLMDLIGNDVNYAVSCSVYEQLGQPERLRPSIIQEQKVKEGKLGRKTGAGYYTYST